MSVRSNAVSNYASDLPSRGHPGGFEELPIVSIQAQDQVQGHVRKQENCTKDEYRANPLRRRQHQPCDKDHSDARGPRGERLEVLAIVGPYPQQATHKQNGSYVENHQARSRRNGCPHSAVKIYQRYATGETNSSGTQYSYHKYLLTARHGKNPVCGSNRRTEHLGCGDQNQNRPAYHKLASEYHHEILGKEHREQKRREADGGDPAANILVKGSQVFYHVPAVKVGNYRIEYTRESHQPYGADPAHTSRHVVDPHIMSRR